MTEPFSRFFHDQSFPHPHHLRLAWLLSPFFSLELPRRAITTLTAALLQGCAEGSAHLALLPRRGQEVWEPEAQSSRLLPVDLPERSVSTWMPLGQHPTSLAHRTQAIPESDTGNSRPEVTPEGKGA